MSETPYRAASPPEPEPPDPEHQAIAELARRTKRLRGIVVIASFFVGLFGTACIYDAFSGYYEAHGRAMPIKMAIIASFVLSMIPALMIGPRLSNALVRMRRVAWLGIAAEKYGVDRDQLDEMTASF